MYVILLFVGVSSCVALEGARKSRVNDSSVVILMLWLLNVVLYFMGMIVFVYFLNVLRFLKMFNVV